VGLGEILTNNGNGDAAIKAGVKHPPVLGPPGYWLLHNAAQGSSDGAKAPRHPEGVAPYEASGEIGLIKLLADDAENRSGGVAPSPPGYWDRSWDRPIPPAPGT
jgi:hypothetical protein